MGQDGKPIQISSNDLQSGATLTGIYYFKSKHQKLSCQELSKSSMDIIWTIIFWDLLTYVLLGGMVTIIGSDGKPTQVSASSLQLPKNLNALPGLGNAASISGIYFVTGYYTLNNTFFKCCQ